MFDRVRARVHIALLTVSFWARTHWDVGIGIITIIGGYFTNDSRWEWLLWAVSALAFYHFFLSIREYYRRQHRPISVNFAEVRLDGSTSSWQRFLWRNDAAIYSLVLNSRLHEARNPLAFPPDKFRLQPHVLELLSYILIRIKSGIQFDDYKVRLTSDVTEQILTSNRAVLIQSTRYFWGIGTNEMALRQILDPSRIQPIEFDGRFLWLANPGVTNVLLSLSDSFCSNHIGVSTLAITTTGRIPIVKQGEGPSQSRGLYAPSGSGSLDWRDVREVRRLNTETLQELVLHGMARELVEECNLRNDDLIGTYLVGHARLLHRGGKPDFFGLTILRDRKGLFEKVRRSERKYIEVLSPYRARNVIVEGGLDSDALREALKELSQEYNDASNTSILLQLNIMFVQEFLSSGGKVLRC